MNKYYDECYFVNYDSYDDLSLFEVGCQKCPPEHSYGPVIRSNYVLHYVISGEGVLYLNNQRFTVSPGQAFITPPNLVSYYCADTEDPWDYTWIHFNGNKAKELLLQCGVTTQQPIYIPKSSENRIQECMREILRCHADEYACIGSLYKLFQAMIDVSPVKTDNSGLDNALRYIKITMDFITRKYADPITVQDIADHCGLNRSYLCKIFKGATNYSPQEYLIFYRMKKAKHLLKNPDILIQHVAYSVGYPDPYAFSKIFKKEIGMSPRQFRDTYNPDDFSDSTNTFEQ